MTDGSGTSGMPPQYKICRDSETSSRPSSMASSSGDSPTHVADDDSGDEPLYKRAKLHSDLDSTNVLYRDSPMPISAFVPHNNIHIKIENPSPERPNFSDLSPDSADSAFSSSGSFLPTVPSPIPSHLLGDDSASAFTRTMPRSESEARNLNLIKLQQIRSAFTNTTKTANRPKSIGQIFALKKRIKQAQLNGDASLTSLSHSQMLEREARLSSGDQDEDSSSPTTPKKVSLCYYRSLYWIHGGWRMFFQSICVENWVKSGGWVGGVLEGIITFVHLWSSSYLGLAHYSSAKAIFFDVGDDWLWTNIRLPS